MVRRTGRPSVGTQPASRSSTVSSRNPTWRASPGGREGSAFPRPYPLFRISTLRSVGRSIAGTRRLRSGEPTSPRAGARPSTGDETRFGSDRPARRANRCRPHDEADEATVGSPRATGVAPTATTRRVLLDRPRPDVHGECRRGRLVGPARAGPAPSAQVPTIEGDLVRSGDIDHLDGGGHRGGLAGVATPSGTDRDPDGRRSAGRRAR